MPCFSLHQPNTFSRKYLLQTPVLEKKEVLREKKNIRENSYSRRWIREFSVRGNGIQEKSDSGNWIEVNVPKSSLPNDWQLLKGRFFTKMCNAIVNIQRPS